MLPFCLRRTTIQPQLYQQACRLASTGRRVVKPTAISQAQRGFASRGKKSKDEDENDDGESFRWFEKDVHTGEVRRVAGSPEQIEAQELRKKILALETELRQYKDEDVDFDEGMLAALKPEERVKVEKALAIRRTKEAALTEGLELSLALPRTSVPLLKRLNLALRNVALNPTSLQYRKELWRWYNRAKFNIPALPRMVPDRAWEVLWHTQTSPTVTSPEHVCQLFGDMQSVGQPLKDEQKHLYIEALLDTGDTERALQTWNEYYIPKDINSPQLLKVGCSLFIELRDFQRALQLLEEYISCGPGQDPGVILNLLAANADVGNDHMAFALYLVLRSYLNKNMTIDHYDMVAIIFLNCGKKDLALAVFRDMMLRGKDLLRDGNFDFEAQTQLYQAIIKRMEILHSSATSMSEINFFSLSTLSVMPHEWQNKFFYGKWLKRLLGLRQLDGAAKVVEMMYERNIMPDTKHVNGLVGAFLRSLDADVQAKGVELAWSMIQKRLQFTAERRARRRAGLEIEVASVHDTEEDGVEVPVHLDRRVPRASLETFNVLALHFVLTHQWKLVRHLHKVLRAAEYNMDTYFMNHLLQMKLYTEGAPAAWRDLIKYTKFAPPDMETYRFLWAAEIRHMDRKKTVDRTGFPLPRQLFTLMMTWLSDFDDKGKAKARQGFDVGIYGYIMQSFCMDMDYAGALVAIHAVAKHLGQYPEGRISYILTTAISNIGVAPERRPTLRSKRGVSQLPASAAKLKSTTDALAAISKRRAAAAEQKGTMLQDMAPEARAQEGVNMLSELVRIVLVKTSKDPTMVESMIKQAAQEMGVEGIATGDVDASEVV